MPTKDDITPESIVTLRDGYRFWSGVRKIYIDTYISGAIKGDGFVRINEVKGGKAHDITVNVTDIVMVQEA